MRSFIVSITKCYNEQGNDIGFMQHDVEGHLHEASTVLYSRKKNNDPRLKSNNNVGPYCSISEMLYMGYALPIQRGFTTRAPKI